MKYFASCTCVEDLKAEYKRLALKHHPDCGGDTATMQEINAAYEKAFSRLKDIHRAASGETYKAAEPTQETASAFMDIINQIIGLRGITIELIGRWIWVTGDTRPHKDTLKAAGFNWCKNKVAWTWHLPEDRKTTKRRYDMAEIRDMFGSQTFATQERFALN